MPSAPGHRLSKEREVRNRRGRYAGRNVSGQGHTGLLQPQESRGGDPQDHGHQRRGSPRQKVLHPEEHRQHDDCQNQRREARLGNMLQDGKDVVEETALLNVYAQQLGYLVDQDDQADARLEPGQDRVGDEIGQEPQPEQTGQQQKGAGQQGQRGCRGHQARRVSVGYRQGQLGGREDGEGRGAAHAQRARSPQDGINEHGYERHIKSRLYRQPGDNGEGHGLGNHDGGRSQSGQHIEAEPFLLVSG